MLPCNWSADATRRLTLTLPLAPDPSPPSLPPFPVASQLSVSVCARSPLSKFVSFSAGGGANGRRGRLDTFCSRF